jgi:signal transduction histidine kinase
MIKRLTQELRRQEVEIWKKVIRVISHELNNSLAPISSLSHSGRLIMDKPEELHRLSGVFDTIEERAAHLKQFLEGYARFARLPRPRAQHVAWSGFFEKLSDLSPFRLEGLSPTGEAMFDPSQMEQVMLNLLKNARESGSPEDQIRVRLETAPGAGARIQVLDRGSGMSEEVMRQALLPFYTSKPAGTGLGLPLSREIVEAHGGWLRVENREGGGCAVTIWLPPG